MKKNRIAAIVIALGLVTIGAMSASAAETGCSCAEKQALLQYRQDTGNLTKALQARQAELRELFLQETMDLSRADRIEGELRELKGKIGAAAEQLGIPACSRS
jgi:peptidoglycan hydrolase CwlO-like protein